MFPFFHATFLFFGIFTPIAFSQTTTQLERASLEKVFHAIQYGLTEALSKPSFVDGVTDVRLREIHRDETYFQNGQIVFPTSQASQTLKVSIALKTDSQWFEFNKCLVILSFQGRANVTCEESCDAPASQRWRSFVIDLRPDLAFKGLTWHFNRPAENAEALATQDRIRNMSQFRRNLEKFLSEKNDLEISALIDTDFSISALVKNPDYLILRQHISTEEWLTLGGTEESREHAFLEWLCLLAKTNAYQRAHPNQKKCERTVPYVD